MVLTLLQGYPDFVGKRQIFAGSGTGPVLYNATTGDVLTLSNPRLYIDAVFGGIQTVGGTYILYPRISAVGERQTWSLHWYVAATGAEVTTVSATNLSAVQVQLGGFCGQY
jgi:hypothetical protein